MKLFVFFSLLVSMAVNAFAQVTPLETIVLSNSAGLEWRLQRFSGGWALGQIFLNGQPVEKQASQGMLILRNISNGNPTWVYASNASENDGVVTLTGSTNSIGTNFSFTMEVSLDANLPAAIMNYEWDVANSATNWEVCLKYHDGFDNNWRMSMATRAANATSFSDDQLDYVGLPGPIMYRPDWSMATLFVTDYTFDYCNHSSWTRYTGMHFANGSLAPEFRIPTNGLVSSRHYEYPVQILFSDAGSFKTTIPDLMEDWISLNNWTVTPYPEVRTVHENMNLFASGRKNTTLWHADVGGYEVQRKADFISPKNSAPGAVFDYRMYMATGDTFWRNRAFSLVEDFIYDSQILNTGWDYGRVIGQYQTDIDEWDDGNRKRPGIMPPVVSMTAGWLMEMWKLVKDNENEDHTEWYNRAMLMAQWVMDHAFANGSIPQTFELDHDPMDAANPGRSLVAFKKIARITGDPTIINFLNTLEQWTKTNVEDKLYFTGYHVDRDPEHKETHGIWSNVQYLLDKYEETSNQDYLDRAVACAYLHFHWRTPKQLPWVSNPTEGATDEQQSWHLLTVYPYDNRYLECLYRLYQKTSNQLWLNLYNRILQLNFWSTLETGADKGNIETGVADPWLHHNKGYNFQEEGKPYHAQYALDLALMLWDLNPTIVPDDNYDPNQTNPLRSSPAGPSPTTKAMGSYPAPSATSRCCLPWTSSPSSPSTSHPRAPTWSATTASTPTRPGACAKKLR